MSTDTPTQAPAADVDGVDKKSTTGKQKEVESSENGSEQQMGTAKIKAEDGAVLGTAPAGSFVAAPTSAEMASIQAQAPPTPIMSVSLYVGDLLPDVTEAHLFEIFNPVGPVASVRVCRDINTRRSLGYAYVNFHHAANAERALDTMNYTPIKDKPCRIMWSQRDPALRKNGSGNVFVKNLSKEIDNKTLADTFSMFGNILSCKVVDGQSGSKNYGFIHFEAKASADAAIENVNGKLLCGQQVYVGPFISKKERATNEHVTNKFNNLYVKNLNPTVDDNQLLAKFAEFGSIISAVVSKNEQGISKGVGFVCYENPDDAKRAVESMNEKEWEGQELYVGKAQKKAERQSELRNKFLQEKQSSNQGSINLFIKNLDDSIDDEQLRTLFVPYGTISSAKVMKDEKGNSKGFGFVCFSLPEEATRAVTELNGQRFGTAGKPIYVALHQRKDERQAQLSMQYAQQRMPNMRMPGPHPMFGMQGPPMHMQHQTPGFNLYGQPMGMPKPRWSGPPPGRGPPGPGGFGGPGPVSYVGMPVQVGPGPQGVPGQPHVGPPGRAGPGMNRNPNVANPNNRGMRGPARINSGTGPGLGASMQRGPRGGFKYQPNVRNPGLQGQGLGGPQMGGMAGPGGPRGGAAAAALNASMLAAASPEEQKMMLGDRLFPIISSYHPEDGSKITGMLLEMDNSELLHLLEAPEALRSKVAEAVAVLDQHRQKVSSVEDAGVDAITSQVAAINIES